MRKISFVISGKENERRRALIPQDLEHIRNRKYLYFEQGYGEVLGFSDEDYRKKGANVVSREESYTTEIVCNPKAPRPSERLLFGQNQTLFGWIHAVQGKKITDFLIERKMTAIAWEDMFEGGRHLFWRNNELAGEAAILHAVGFLGRHPGKCKTAIIGRGNCARGAFRILSQLGAEIIIYDRKTALLLREEISQYDVVVNAILWDIFRTDHLVYKEDIAKMKPGSMLIDISCDPGMGIETCQATTFNDPVYEVDGVIHYAVDHTPALFYRTATESISAVVCRFVDDLVEAKEPSVLKNATIIRAGEIIDERILRFQKR